MSEYKMVHDILQRIDDDLIDEAVNAKRVSSPIRKFATAAAVVLICIFLSVGVVAAISPTFREWLMEQFQSEIVPEITKLELPDEVHRIENGFIIQDEESNEEVYRIKEKKLVLCHTNILQGTVSYDGKQYDYSLKYAKEGKEVYGWNFDGIVIGLNGYDETTGIIEFMIDDIRSSYFVDYLSGVITPAAEGFDIHVSTEGSYLLYCSKREYLVNEEGKGEWFVQNVKTGEETKLEGASSYLHSSEIGFIDDSHISISWFGDELYPDTFQPAIYDCDTNTVKKLGEMPGGNYGCTQIYEIVSEQGDYEFIDLYRDETYVIPRSSGARISSSYATRSLICLMENTGTLKAYLINENTALDFDKTAFSDMEEIRGMHDLGNNQYLIEGISNDKQVGYLLEFPELMEENVYRCHVTYPEREKLQEISLTEEEIAQVLAIIVNSESEIMSSENENMKYGEKEAFSINLTVKNEAYEFVYRLAVSEEDILTYSIEKKSLNSGKVTEKNYVIYSEELYNLVMEKTGGMKDEE